MRRTLLLLALCGLTACSTATGLTTSQPDAAARPVSLVPAALGGPVADADAGPFVGPVLPTGSAPPRPASELPRGGRTIFPTHVVVMAYGTAGTGSLGVLGEVPPEEASQRLLAGAIPYAKASGRQILPAFELITTVAQRSPGADGSYSFAQPEEQVQRYLDVARAHKYLLVLDFQPGRATFLEQVKRYERFLRQPDVGIALDPEWVLKPGQQPSRQIGTTDAATINEVSAYVAGIVEQENLPEKLFIVHQFQTRMIPDREQVIARPGLSTLVHVDGFGGQKAKKDTYRVLAATEGAARTNGQLFNGFKLFLDEDTDLMTPAEAMALTPQPDLVSYQ